jgi:RNA polymerase sigma-70 factor (ECF subfamily)
MHQPGQNLDDLMHRAQKGDKRAYADLLREITPLLRAFIRHRLTALDDTDDVVQNILLSIHRAGHTYDSARPFKTWMFAIARHRLNDYLREKYRSGTIVSIPIDAAPDIAAPDVTSDADLREYLQMMLDTLPPKQRKIITMMKLDGYSAQDVAHEMKMSLSAVKVAAHRAYKTLALAAENGPDR